MMEMVNLWNYCSDILWTPCIT